MLILCAITNIKRILLFNVGDISINFFVMLLKKKTAARIPNKTIILPWVFIIALSLNKFGNIAGLSKYKLEIICRMINTFSVSLKELSLVLIKNGIRTIAVNISTLLPINSAIFGGSNLPNTEYLK
jgi:hypothetical protein